MKNYTITVNGNVYDVTVEENGSTGAAAPAPRKMAAAPKQHRQQLQKQQAQQEALK